MPSTPDPLVEVIAAAVMGKRPISTVDGMKFVTLADLSGDDPTRETYFRIARRVLAAITAAGRLLPPATPDTTGTEEGA